MKLTRLTLPAMIAVALAVPAGQAGAGQIQLDDAAWGGAGTAETIQVGQIEHVARVPYAGGSDLEFVTREVTKLSNGATGDPVCETDASGDCVVDGDGNIVYQTEERDFAIAGVLSAAGRVIDITNPREPVQVATLPCRFYQNDIQLWGDYVLQGADGTGSCTRPDGTNASATVGISDLSDPRNPFLVGRFTQSLGAHNLTVHPTQPVIYISNSELVPGGTIHIWEFSNPAAPTKVKDWTYAAALHPPHDVTFNAAGTRGYAAAISSTLILNTEDPKNPALISVIPNEGISISHQSDPTPDGKFLLVSDELGGGGAPTVSPGGPVHIYDISVEQHPQKIGAFGNDTINAGAVSTSHVFRINPDGYTMGIAWYQDGAGVIDYSDVRGLNAAGAGAAAGTGPRVVAWMKMPGADVWSAKMWHERHPGYLFANDIALGFDVFYLPELDNGFIGTGSIRGGQPGSSLAGGAAELEWSVANGCNGRPVSQGVDGWVYEDLPEGSGDGNHTIHVTVSSPAAAAADLTIWFYDEGCELMSLTGAASGAPVPEGAAHAVVNAFTGGNVRIMTYVR